ncbi:putative organ specific protein [Helianthus annuus]|uniref:Organ specific protein n=1 Tax=Helianthus annuus TaxID=4232 RepID=A0A251RX20_HELAN|nr:putative organ specific protein [Helianthus annuus]KAJ0441411.1 putative organ specific protein [Helianthus annuus]KAJ0643859.1 putative organ specific protein [Helianthus annuus]KAJ0814397.1 putative organ specific protein [Helianthus annuus]KAJ0820049.1 putative organ specific protein [Helianthus annuus]
MMKLKSLSTLITFFSLLLILSRIEARSDPREYWRSVMKDEPMPKTIQDVLPLEDGMKVNKDIFTRNFNLKPNLIIYRSHVVYSEKNHHIVSSSSSSFDELN